MRDAVRIVNETLNILRVVKHPDKTFIGKVDRGFDFLGYFLKPGMLNVSISTLKRFAQRIAQLYEQGADIVRIGEYVRHWCMWVRAGITGTDKTLLSSACPSLSSFLNITSNRQ